VSRMTAEQRDATFEPLFRATYAATARLYPHG
jgi:hypothetical protein